MRLAVHRPVAVGERVLDQRADVDGVLDHGLGSGCDPRAVAESVGIPQAGRAGAEDDAQGVGAVTDGVVAVAGGARGTGRGVVDAAGDPASQLGVVAVHPAVDVGQRHAGAVGAEAPQKVGVAGPDR